MSSGLRIKNVIFKRYDNMPAVPKTAAGIDILHRKKENNEDHVSITGTQPQINSYLQEAAKDIISERCRTLSNVPKYRLIGSKKVRIY